MIKHNTSVKTLEATHNIKRLIPTAFKRVAKEWLQNAKLKNAIREIRELPLGDSPDRQMLESLQRGWANEGYAARTDYLEELARAAVTTPGPILECGSGLTTILLGLLAGRRGVATWSLEHIPDWKLRVDSVLDQLAIQKVQVCSSPLLNYGGFHWYDPPPTVLSEQFRLVICDGPPGTTTGGRYGLLPVMGNQLSAGAVILLDDTSRVGELEVVHRWMAEKNVDVSYGGSDKSFAIITVR